MKIIFFGTPEFGKIILERLIESKYKPILVVTTPDKPVGRKQILTPPPVKILAEKYGINILQPEQILNSKSEILILKPDLIVVAAYGKIILKGILDIPKYSALNVHPSLLPLWRGPSPIQYAILNGDKETGVTIMLMDEELDHGPIIAQQELEILNHKHQILNKSKISISKLTSLELNKILADLGAKLLIETIPRWINGEIEPKEQDHKKATYSKILTKEDGHMDWSKSAEEIERQIRAFIPWPGSFTFWNNKRLKIIKTRIVKNPNPEHNIPQKVYLASGGDFCVATGEGVLFIEKLQPDGKNEMTSKQFFNGHPDIIGALLK